MKFRPGIVCFVLVSLISCQLSAQNNTTNNSTQKPANSKLFIDVHNLGPGKVTYQAVAEAHAKDLATQGKYNIQFLKFWVDENKGLVYCLSSASDSTSIRKTHAEAHGLLPDTIYQVTDGGEAAFNNDLQNLFLDIHYMGAGKVTAKDVEKAHKLDLAVQQKHGVNLINYWVDEKAGVIMCLAQAADSASLTDTHKEAHGLLPAKVFKVKQSQ